MSGQRRFRWSLLALVGLAVASLVPGTGRAGIILRIVPIPGYDTGMLACVDQQCAFAPSTQNPTHAIFGTVEAALAQGGSSMRFLFSVQGTAGQNQFASTAPAPAFANSIQIAILGTAGEPVGTPVSLRLASVTTGDPGSAEAISNSVNSMDYAINTDEIINSLKVGDTISYWGAVNMLGNNPLTLEVLLSAQVVSAEIPEAGTLALLMTAGLALGVLSQRRGRRSLQCGQARARPRQREPAAAAPEWQPARHGGGEAGGHAAGY